MPWLAPESNATLLRYWSPFIVPGIAQTKAYMHALFEDEGHLLDHADEMASARLQRQQVIGRIPVTIIIGYHVLYRVVGSPAVMSVQMGHLATLAERSMVALHVLPETVTTGSYGELGIATGGEGTTVSMPLPRLRPMVALRVPGVGWLSRAGVGRPGTSIGGLDDSG